MGWTRRKPAPASQDGSDPFGFSRPTDLSVLGGPRTRLYIPTRGKNCQKCSAIPTSRTYMGWVGGLASFRSFRQFGILSFCLLERLRTLPKDTTVLQYFNTLKCYTSTLYYIKALNFNTLTLYCVKVFGTFAGLRFNTLLR